MLFRSFIFIIFIIITVIITSLPPYLYLIISCLLFILHFSLSLSICHFPLVPSLPFLFVPIYKLFLPPYRLLYCPSTFTSPSSLSRPLSLTICHTHSSFSLSLSLSIYVYVSLPLPLPLSFSFTVSLPLSLY